MKAAVIQIEWHPSDAEGGKNAPLMALDMTPACASGQTVLATAGQDNMVRLWRVQRGKSDATSSGTPAGSVVPGAEGDAARPVHLIDLEDHAQSVNVARFSPNGECLATAGDDAYVVVYALDRTKFPRGEARWDAITSPRQLIRRAMKGHASEVYDLAWSSDSSMVASGSIAGKILLWEALSGREVASNNSHSGFVQGIAWDPKGALLASQCGMARCCVHKMGGDGHFSNTVVIRRRRFTAPLPSKSASGESPASKEESQAEAATAASGSGSPVVKKSVRRPQSHAIFVDNMSMESFFRRLTWSPDGSLLFTPAAQFKQDADSTMVPTVYGYLRGQWDA